MKKLDRKTCSGISPIAGAKKQTSQRTVINIIIAYSENIASYFYLRRGEHQIMKIGARIRQIRQHQHMTQRELGERIGSRKNGANRVAQYEMGYRTPKRDQLNKIAHALNVPEEMFSLEADETLQALLHNLLWLDQDDTTLIELYVLNKENCLRSCNRKGKSSVAIVIHDEAVQNFLRDWCTEKSLIEAGAITQEDYFDWKIHTPL